MSDDWKHDRIGAAERGENPMVLARMASGFAVMGDTQFLPGYRLLLASPQVARLEDLPYTERNRFLADMGLLGEAVSLACRPRRMNYSIYGNTDAFLHAHLFPRYDWEPPERLAKPPFLYPPTNWTDPALAYDEARHGDLRHRIGEALSRLTAPAPARP
jgi:diadenosine tetraphosphate (Ap4A) HIT family hydrolase